MNVTKAKLELNRKLGQAWSELSSGISRIAAGCDVQPQRSADIFIIDPLEPGSMKVKVEPIVFLLKMQPQDDKARLYVTVKGKVNFSVDGGTDPFLAHYFNTEVGYFLEAGKNSLTHILGVHYDHDDRRPAHPVFHAQLTSCKDHFELINDRFSRAFTVKTDLMEHIPRKIRLPTAHMDPLSVFLQLLADHLMNENSGAIETAAFEKVRKSLMFFRSDPHQAERLESVHADSCFRGPRWYLPAMRSGAET